MKKVLVLFAITVLVLPLTMTANESFRQKQGWSFTLGAGSIYAPYYLGDDDYRLSMFPNFQVAYEDKFFASVRKGIGYNIVNHKNFKAGPVIKYNFGRDEDGKSPFGLGDDTDELIGLGDVDGALEVGAYAMYKFSSFTASIEVRQGLNGGHEGLVGEAGIAYGGTINLYEQRIIYSVGPQMTYTDSNYNEAFFSVDNLQSMASGLAIYEADETALSYGVGLTVIAPLNKRLSALFFASYEKLANSIADSSLVEERGSEHQFRCGLFLNYTF